MKSRLLLNVVIRKGAAIFELLAGEDETLLVRRDAFPALFLRLHVVDGVRGLHLEGDRLPCEGLDEDLHATTQTEDEMKGRLLLDVVVAKSAAVLELLAGEDQALLVRRDARAKREIDADDEQSILRTPPCPGSWP